jgi:hypothetical protein
MFFYLYLNPLIKKHLHVIINYLIMHLLEPPQIFKDYNLII